MNTQALTSLAITGAVLYAAWKWGTPEVRGMALGAAGYILLNNLPVARNGLQAQVLAA